MPYSVELRFDGRGNEWVVVPQVENADSAHPIDEKITVDITNGCSLS